MKKKCFAIDKLLDEGWFETEKEASAWIMARDVIANDQVIVTPKEKIPEDAVIRIKGSYKRKYVNKGGLKLEAALKSFDIEVDNITALDCGASTGGFTDCLLHHGAKYVYAVDAGVGQLAGKLMIDPKVFNMERTNLGDEVLLSLNPKPELITLDLSYLSLKKAFPICRKILGENGVLISLVKPIYEVESSEIRRNGKINDYDVLKKILTELCNFFIKSDVKIMGIINSPVTGNHGTLEYFIAVHWGNIKYDIQNRDHLEDIETALSDSFKLNTFNKKV